MQAHEDLAALFSKNLTLEPAQPPREESKIVYVSQHYNHSSHLARPSAEHSQLSPRPASEPPQREHTVVETVLQNNGVDPSCLSVSQLQLFKSVAEPQQLRLIELWRIFPPTNSNDNPTLAWSFTTVEQEESLAQMRYVRNEQGKQAEQIMSLDGTPLTPIQAGDGRWISTQGQHDVTEPYMATGYEEMARREYEESARRAYAAAMERPKDVYQHFGTAVGGPTYSHATDPVYKAANATVDWIRQAHMEDQYGRMMQTRDEEMF
ncbi:hypothetical protein QBC33DRAFT_556272 [Phialemonium atrogriseum]|uniref:Uncharacterized protein n=1 Tax=Phialemonium atrogriseum TaxID=1093897 RepID=A0AAJ0C713_9PEZI|nr:uncharacterized protein QBC33DRAFT_556272 [Phialemonium atrogriseum]KAK1769849.1 hypothetical protein QBC33DRAFT_556272 [Phialemonium atrogriseum]